jgi:transposase InsO family protein
LEGETFIIEVDHKNLTILKDSINQKVQRWKNFLQRFDAKWRYIPGPDNTVADGLSRMGEPKDKETAEEVVIRDIILHLQESSESEPEAEGKQEVIPARSPQGYREQAKKLVTSSNDKNRERDTEEVFLLSKDGEEEERSQKLFLKDVITKFHNKTNGHLGINKTMQCVEAYMHDNPDQPKNIPYKVRYQAVKEFIESCPICQKSAKEFEKLYTEPFIGSTYEPMECVQIDHIGPIGSAADSYGNTHILVMVDTFTRWVELYPVPNVGAETTAMCLGDYMLRYGPPRVVHSDSGSAFIDASFNALAKMANIKITHPIAGDKESTGIVERENREVRRHLNNLMNENFMKDSWSIATKMVQRILNNTVHTTTGYAPAKLLYGRLIKGLDTIYQKPVGAEDKEYVKYMKSKIDLQGKILKFMKEKMMHQDKINLANRAHPKRQILEAGEAVLYRRKSKSKAQLDWTGPYIVTDKVRDHYQLTSLLGDQTPFYAHARNLKRFKTQEGVDMKEIALMDENLYEIDEIKQVAAREGVQNPSSRYAQMYGVTYEGFPDDIHWLKYDEVKLEKAMVRWCLKNNHWGWIDAQAKIIHRELIDQDGKDKAIAKAEVKAQKEARKQQKISKKRQVTSSLEELALEGIRKRARKSA